MIIKCFKVRSLLVLANQEKRVSGAKKIADFNI